MTLVPEVDVASVTDDEASQRFTEVGDLASLGFSSPGVDCRPKTVAIASLVNLAAPEPVPVVGYKSRGNLLVIAGNDPSGALAAARRLALDLHVTVLGAGFDVPESVLAWEGRLESLDGYLGEFTATIAGLRTRAAPAALAPTPARFDLVLDFGDSPFAMRHPPQGYFRAPQDAAALDAVLAELRDSVGEFEKPRFFAYRENLCAHSRSEITGCSNCIDICSTGAISSAGDHVKVDPHLCMGCGACSTVCPSGAMGYQFPKVADRGAQVKQLVHAYRHAGGEDPCIVFHDATSGAALLARAAREGAGLPPRALPLEAWNVAAIGIDLLLPAIAFGANQVALLVTPEQDRDYVAALLAQAALAQTIVSALGYGGTHFAVIEAADPGQLESRFAALAPATPVPVPATFLLSNDKRTAVEFAVEHLAKHAPARVDEIALPAGSPFGEVRVDQAKCTMCLSCAGACPASALMDGADRPMLKFVERNCVQCGLCEQTCPEDAITLHPRLLLTPAVREQRVLNETQPFHCVSCNKPFGTRQMVDAMMGRLASHSMFSGEGALRRLQMCADCRVVDMMQSRNEVSVLRLGSGS